MTVKQPDKTSQFNARTDRAALSLRQTLKQRGVDIPDSRSVEVTEDGKPPAQLPPEGSYARQNIELQRRQAASQRPQLQDDGDIEMQRQDPQATLESDQDTGAGEVATTSEPPQLSANAQRRIAELTENLRRKDQELQSLVAEGKQTKAGFSELEKKISALQEQHSQVLDQRLAEMDPETRTQILMDGRLEQAIAASEQRIMSQVIPHLSKMERQSVDAEMRRLSSIYPGFRIETHGQLIETFRQSNPKCTVEQAFRAVAEPEELQMAPQVRASAVPPVVQPGNGRVQSRYENPKQRSSPEDELIAEAQQLKKLMSSTDPNDKSGRDRFVHQHLVNRLGNKIPR